MENDTTINKVKFIAAVPLFLRLSSLMPPQPEEGEEVPPTD